MAEIEYKQVDATGFKVAPEGNGTIAGYGSVFGNVDSYNDAVMPGAYAGTLDKFLKSGFIAVGHDWSVSPVAYPVEAYEDDHGLFLRAEFHSTPEAQSARRVVSERMAAGKSVGLSIGYTVGDATFREDGVRELRAVDLYEVSIVTVPANREAVVTGAKSGPLAGRTFGEHSESVRTTVEEFVVRARAIAALRAKEGRVLSTATRARIAAARESMSDAVASLVDVDADLAELLAATEPQAKADGTVERRLYAEFLRSMSV